MIFYKECIGIYIFLCVLCVSARVNLYSLFYIANLDCTDRTIVRRCRHITFAMFACFAAEINAWLLLPVFSQFRKHTDIVICLADEMGLLIFRHTV